MRELEFRAWDNLEKRMRKVVSLHWRDGKPISVRLEGENEPISIEGRLVIEQDTGLKDKNGTEIYEGDIVKVERDGIIYRVEWIHGGFGLEPRYNAPYYPRLGNVELREKIEVIGNIHENPELIKQGGK
nr:MAG TPA: YopX protein [Caudoviricetes sp.]